MLKRGLLLFLAAFIVAVLHAQIFSSSWGSRIEPLGLNLWFNLRGPVAPPQDVVIVAMDESSYRVLNVPLDKAWPRDLHVELLKRLHQYGVKRVVMDILFLGEGSDPIIDRNLADAMKLLLLPQLIS